MGATRLSTSKTMHSLLNTDVVWFHCFGDILSFLRNLMFARQKLEKQSFNDATAKIHRVLV